MEHNRLALPCKCVKLCTGTRRTHSYLHQKALITWVRKCYSKCLWSFITRAADFIVRDGNAQDHLLWGKYITKKKKKKLLKLSDGVILTFASMHLISEDNPIRRQLGQTSLIWISTKWPEVLWLRFMHNNKKNQLNENCLNAQKWS